METLALLGTACLLAVSALRAEGPVRMGVDSLPASALKALEAAAAKPDPAAAKTPAEAKPAEKAAAKPADPHAALVQHPTIQKLLKLAKLDAVFKIYNTEEEAVAAESGSPTRA